MSHPGRLASLLHGQETDVHGDADYQGADKRPDAAPGVRGHVATKPGKRRALDKDSAPGGQLMDELEPVGRNPEGIPPHDAVSTVHKVGIATRLQPTQPSSPVGWVSAA